MQPDMFFFTEMYTLFFLIVLCFHKDRWFDTGEDIIQNSLQIKSRKNLLVEVVKFRIFFLETFRSADTR